METTEKLYYSVVVLVAAVSVLLSPFFHARRTGTDVPKPRKPVAWWLIIASYLIVAALLLTLAYVIFFKQ